MAAEVLQMFPALDPATEAALRSSIEQFGVIVPAVLDQNGRTLDGHHRQRLADELGVECPTLTIPVRDDDQAAEIARTLNMDRRHLDAEVRRAIAADLREQGHSLRAIAGALGVSHEQVRNDLGTVNDLTVPERVVGRDGKSRPSTRQVVNQLADSGLCDPALIEEEAEAILDEYGKAEDVADIEEVVDECIESKRLPITKPDLGGGVSHPARFSDPLFEHFREMLQGFKTVLDPFAGTGRIHELRPEWETTGVELEPEWANLSTFTIIGNALALPFDDGSFDAVCTSPTYGNRLADHHNASDPHLRRSYTHDLGRDLTVDNSGVLHWGDEYRTFHTQAWKEASRILRPGGRFIVNIKDHIRGGDWQDVAVWHLRMLLDQGYRLIYDRAVPTSSLRQGANGDLRVVGEHVFALDKP